MYLPAASEAEAAAFGFTLADIEPDPVEIWPDNMLAVQVFDALDTQWRVGFNGPIGLDYNVLREIWQRLKVPTKERDQVFSDLRIMESAALKQMRANK